MNQNLIEKLKAAEEYMKVDKQALSDEMKRTQETINELKEYKKSLAKISNLTKSISESKLNHEYKDQLIEVMTQYPQLRSIREAEVMFQASQALSNKEIGERLFICEKTVKFHKTNIFRRCGLKNTLDLIRNLHIKAKAI